MEGLTLAEVQTFHAQLASITSLGIPLRITPLGTKAVNCKSLDEIETFLAAAVGRGSSIESTLQDAAQIPEAYAKALRRWHCDHHQTEALDLLWDSSEPERVARRWWAVRFMPPTIWILLGELVLIAVCLMVVPQFEALRQQIGAPTGFALSVLLGVRSTMYIWGPTVPLILIGLVVLLARAEVSGGLSRRKPVVTMVTPGERDGILRQGAAVTLLGGVVVLLIALSVFGPLVEFLIHASAPARGPSL